MEEQGQDPNSPSQGSERNEPVRSRWTPKPEQILILESIFNSGMVNPPRDETVRIRKLLEKFGSVGDANVFYWFQNRRSRSRRRQRQMQASLEQRNQAKVASSATQFESTSSALGFGPLLSSPSFASSPSYHVGSSSSCGVLGNDGVDHSHFSLSGQMGFPEIEQGSAVTPAGLCPSDASDLQYQTVFINGVPTEVPKGPLDIKAMFDQDVVLVHCSGVPVAVNEFGFLMQGLQHGESYFLMEKLKNLKGKKEGSSL
ncbi:WUSCHEL-related homeobox 11-like isoform X2 [Juglans microcarpa x Juglans regia]|uniref:WUSCHEL-related homeobox 11-like isoform X2 n=1 Tax=Juglans microcarpa x Juglans regia TaxID=2249226 RepID=UPI001B7DC29B|nr:WUSCHEL-related homeobox 11-like isoform X2 [Juglans microcarpa x Juglans regia]